MILTTTQIAARLGVSERTAQRGLNGGTIRARQVARARYEMSEVVNALQSEQLLPSNMSSCPHM